MKQLSAHAPLPIYQLNNHVTPAKCLLWQRHTVRSFRLSSLGYAIALGSVTAVMPVTYTHAAPIASAVNNQNSLSKNTNNSSLTANYPSSNQPNSLPNKQITDKAQVNNAVGNRKSNDGTANNTSNNTIADDDNNVDNADNNKYDNNKAYQYPISSPQGIAHQIDKQLDNDKLSDYNNFNQPAATLQRNKPTVGYNKALDNVAVPKLPPKTSPPINSTNLTSQNQPVNPDNPATSNNTAQQNNANESADIAKDTDINPDDYLPAYQQQPKNPDLPAAPKIIVANEKPNPLKRLYYRLINRTPGVDYIDIKIANADPKQQPAKNIKAALEEVTVESVADFNASIKRLRQIAQDAAEAVGYYDTEVSFKALGEDKIQVTINKVGKPVLVNSRVIDIRGEGGSGDDSLSVYQAIKEDIAPQKGEVFNHGTYKQTKATIENVARTNGFFDAKWLDNSVEVILPDNTADVSLIYDTKGRYKFGDVKIYTLDKKGQLSDDPNKLPIKPELLQQLINYKQGDPYYQPYITEFTNNLSATRYFNGIDVDVVLPPNEGNQATLGTDNSAGDNMAITGEVSDSTVTANQASAATVANQGTASQVTSAMPSSGTTVTNLTGLSNAVSASDATSNAPNAKLVSNSNNDKPNKQTQNPADIAPLDFSADASTQERLKAIKNKAENLLDAPDDIELASGDNNPNRSALATIANAISNVAKKIDRRDEDKIQLSQANQSDVIAKQTPEQVYQQKAIPTYVVLNANKRHEAQVGLGYETDVGVRVTGKLNNNLVNRNGLQAGVNVALSRVDQSLEVNGSYPYKHPLNDKITGSLGYQHRNIDDLVNTFETDSIYANIARNIYRDTGWNRTYSMRYRSDKLSLNSDQYKVENLPAPFNNYASDFTQQALLFGYALSKTVADNLLSPTYGYSQRYSVELGGDGILADTNLAILRAGVTGLYSFGQDKKQQVLGRLDLGYIYSDDFLHVPYRLRFFAGGDQSIRGYNTDSQGPRYGKQDFLIGGDALAVGSLEYNYEFRPGLRAALFSDFGNAYDINDDYRNSTKVGVGAGIRWASPIGTVRLDVASGLSESGEPIRLHFFIGSPL